jgi:polyisoprenoid-binding protein YceI
MPQATKVRYLIDAKGGTFTVRAFATGMLSAFGHNPTIAIPDVRGEIQFASDTLEDASLRMVIQAASLVVTDDISAKDRQEIERKMHDEVLEADAFPEIIYECPRVSSVRKMGDGSYSVSLDGELALHGVTRSQPVAARVTLKGDRLRATGEFSIRQSDYEIRPVSAAGGTVKLKDELKLSFDISARKQE